VKARFGDRRKAMLEDIAVSRRHRDRRGGGCRSSKATLEDSAGQAGGGGQRKTRCHRGAGDPTAIDARIAAIRQAIKMPPAIRREKLQEPGREAAGRVAGSRWPATETEMKERKSRVGRAARDSRAIERRDPGARRALRARRDRCAARGNLDQDAHSDRRRALEEPLRRIVATRAPTLGGGEPRRGRVRQLRLQRGQRAVRRHGRDGRAGSCKVTRTALQNAASISA